MIFVVSSYRGLIILSRGYRSSLSSGERPRTTYYTLAKPTLSGSAVTFTPLLLKTIQRKNIFFLIVTGCSCTTNLSRLSRYTNIWNSSCIPTCEVCTEVPWSFFTLPWFFFYLAPKTVLNVGPLWLNTGRCIKNYGYGNLAYGSFILFASNLKSLGSLLGKLTGRIVLRKFK